MNKIDLTKIGEKWQKKWNDAGVFVVKEDQEKEKFYILDMFPYPSGSGLHVGHPKGYIASDSIARKKMLEGYSVLHPMGFDTFGLGTENYAIQNKILPQEAAAKNIARFKEQLEMFGTTYDWNREISTADPDMYKWTQRVFLKMYGHYYDLEEGKALPIEKLKLKINNGQLTVKEGVDLEEFIDSQRLAYMDYQPINWCPSCQTGLANEDLDDGKCERCGSEVEQKLMKQWIIRITKYAERLLSGLDELDGWDESTKDMQRNWIGKSVGTEFDLKIKNYDDKISVFTTRIDTIFGVTFVALSPEHPLVDKITTDEYRAEVEKYKEQAKLKTTMERTELNKDKTGVLCGAFVINPFNGKEVPVYIADYVLANYGSGAVMAVPAHDERDFEFAKKYDIEIQQVIEPLDSNVCNIGEEAYTSKGKLINSGDFDGITSEEAILKMNEWLEKNGIGRMKKQYKLRDRVFSRQRYWGEPIPMVHCEKCGIVPLDEKELPLTLPIVENYEPTGTEEGPLANIDEWVNVDCPKCRGKGKRETNTMPGWAGSSRYRLRYMDPKNNNDLVDSEKEKYRGSVNQYIGGAEHITRHMIYARFWNKFLQDIGIVSVSEPFTKYQKVGLIMAEDGRKMSKRRGNTIDPADIIDQYGADVLRIYEMFMGPFDQSVAWSTNGVNGAKKFLEKVIKLSEKVVSTELGVKSAEYKKITSLLHKTIKKVGEDIDGFKFNTAISQMMIFVNEATQVDKIPQEIFEKFVVVLSPLAPHLAEELWKGMGHKEMIYNNVSWPKYDEKLIVEDTINLAVQFNGKMRGTIEVSADISQDEAMEIIKSDEKLNKYLTGDVRKIIFVAGKIVNIIVG